ncbi:MAG: sugar ABC transporter permease [Eubacteriales bacterium]|nr:sugar ABC transporter permease [Eubacteriales bacterium]
MKRQHLRLTTEREITYACFLAPALILYIITVIVPFFQGIPYSFTNWNLISNASNNVGFKNYAILFGSKEFWTAVGNTFQFTGLYVVFSNLIGLGVALLLQRSSKLNNVCRTMIFMPYVISLVTAAFVWRYIYSAVYSPLFNVPSPLGVKNQAMLGIAIISVWRTSGYCMLIYIAGLQGVPQEYYEAASVEGASAIQKFFKITVPMLIPSFSANVSLLLAWGLKVFEVVRATTNGGPTRNATTTMSMFIYNNIFANSKAGYGQAAAIIMTAILLIVSFMVSKFFRSREVY